MRGGIRGRLGLRLQRRFSALVALDQFFAQDLDVGRGRDSQAHLWTSRFSLQDLNDDVVANKDALAVATT